MMLHVISNSVLLCMHLKLNRILHECSFLLNLLSEFGKRDKMRGLLNMIAKKTIHIRKLGTECIQV